MFNVPFQLRESKKYLTPSGYNLWFAPRRIFRVDGTRISFKFPRYNRFHGNPKPPRMYPHYPLNRTIKLYTNDIPPCRINDEEQRDIYYVYDHLLGFFGPWFTGEQATVYFNIYIMRLRKYPPSLSLFHPRSFESVVADLLTENYSQIDCEFNVQRNLAPVDWTPITQLPVNAAHFKVVGQTGQSHQKPYDHIVYAPLDNNIMLGVKFKVKHGSNQPSFIREKYLNMAPVEKLIRDVIASIRIKLAPHAEAAQKEALAGLSDTSLIKEFPPLKWDNLDEKTREETMERVRQDYIDYYEFDGAKTNDNN